MSATTAIPTAELKAAARALLEGRFRPGSPVSPVLGSWSPGVGEQVVAVVGCGGGVGATTVALALATAAAPARLVECCPGSRSGLAAASYAELGEAEAGWLRGRRGEVMIERRADPTPDPVPAPLPAAGRERTVLDVGLEAFSGPGSCYSGLQGVPVVLVTRATLPGCHQLEAALNRLHDAVVVAAVLVGYGGRRWPRTLRYGFGIRTRALDADGRLSGLPADAQLGMVGLINTPLPTKVISAAAGIVAAIPSWSQEATP